MVLRFYFSRSRCLLFQYFRANTLYLCINLVPKQQTSPHLEAKGVMESDQRASDPILVHLHTINTRF